MARYHLEVQDNIYKVIDGDTVPRGELIATFLKKKKAIEYCEILNAKENNIAIILRQISEEVDERSER